MGDLVRIFGVNGAVFGVVTLTELELVLKITLLSATIVWTLGKAANEWKKLKSKN